MPGAMRKLGLYLGLVEDDEHEGYDPDGYADDGYDEPAVRRHPASPTAALSTRRSFEAPRSQGSVALDTAPRPTAVPAYDEGYRITTLHPHSYNDARAIGEHFREGTPVIMNLTEMDDSDAKRLVDFAAGLIFGLRGRIERVTNKVFLLSPEHVEVTAEDKARIAEGGFFNQS
jgi:cell division inhibitor SepF